MSHSILNFTNIQLTDYLSNHQTFGVSVSKKPKSHSPVTIINGIYLQFMMDSSNIQHGKSSMMEFYREKIRPILLSHSGFSLTQKEFIIASIFTKMKFLFMEQPFELECDLMKNLGALDLLIHTGEKEKAALLLQKKNDIEISNYIYLIILGYLDADEPLLKFLLSFETYNNLTSLFIFALEQKNKKIIHIILAKIIEFIPLMRFLCDTQFFKDLFATAQTQLGHHPGIYERLEILVQAGMDLKDLEGPFLFHAVFHADIHSVNALLMNGASVNIVDTHGNSLLSIVAHIANPQKLSADPKQITNLLHLLIERGANVNLGNPKPFELIIDFLDNNQDVEMQDFLLILLQMLLKNANIVEYITDRENRSGKVDHLEYLLKWGADVNGYSLDGTTTLLSWALVKQNYGLAQLLLNYGADPNLQEGFLIKKAVEHLDQRAFNVLAYRNQQVKTGQIPLLAFASEHMQKLTHDYERTKLINMMGWFNSDESIYVSDNDARNWLQNVNKKSAP